jgi:2-amino-4-hydroxy-6-hydroxymethyldihydropteridine diphosphokinase
MKTFLLIGSNIHDRLTNLQTANNWIARNIGHISSSSSIYETEPWGFQCPTNFLNQAIVVETLIEPLRLMKEIQLIENQYGRKRIPGEYSERRIDIDILFYEKVVMQSDELTLPHKHIHNRRFVLEPLIEIAPLWMHPVFNKTLQQLHAECVDTLKVWKFEG